MTIKPLSTTFSDSGELQVGGVSASDLVAKHGSPLYVMDAETLKQNCLDYIDTFKEHHPDAVVAYASKALLTVGIAKRMAALGMGFDVCSGGEIYTLLQAGVDTDTVYFHGNNKSEAELRLAISNHIRIVLDNQEELNRINAIVAKTGQSARLLVRLKPEIEAHTHEYIKTGQIDSKFGVEKDLLIPIIKEIIASEGLAFCGIHAHIGSQIFDVDPYHDLVQIMVGYMEQIKDETGATVDELDLGGGFGIQYISSDDPPNVREVLSRMITELKSGCAELDLPVPKIIVEPGRSVAATAGLTLYTVGTLKSIPGIKEYAFVDGGMADNVRPIMYQADYTFECANRTKDVADTTYTIAGKFCESGDVLAKAVQLPKLKVGDLIAVYGTGAYNYTMSSNYNRYCRPAMVIVENGLSDVLVKRETYEDLVRLDQ